MKWRKKAALSATTIGVATLALAAWAGVSAAVSGGGYQPGQQDCPPNSDAWNAPTGATDPGCHNIAVNVESGGTSNGAASDTNTRYVEWGNNEAPNDPSSVGTPTLLSLGLPGYTGSPHAGCLAANTDGTNGATGTGCGNNAAGTGFEANYDYYAVFCPIMAAAGNPCEDTSPGQNTLSPDTGGAVNYAPIVKNGLLVYFGMNDNTDNGEHDGYTGLDNSPCYTDPTTGTTYYCNSAGAVNGPSDGGSMTLAITLMNIAGIGAPSMTHPEGVANYSTGFCADGICIGATTQQQTVYNGCGVGSHAACSGASGQSDDVFKNNTPASTQEPSNCSSGDAPSESCPSGSSADSYVAATPSYMNTEPGVQTYQDPDPQRSPALPFGTPGLYAGTCGVYVNASSDSVGPGLPAALTGGAVNPPGQWVVGPTQSDC